MKRINTAPSWSVRAQTIMTRKGMTKRDLAQALKVNYNQLVGVMSGGVVNKTMKERICTYFGIDQ